MKRILLSIFSVIAVALVALAATPQQLVGRAASMLKSAPSVQAAYTVRAEGHSWQGMLTLSGDRFTLTAPGLSSWFDGKTQWTYSQQMGEVNVIDPTPDELQQINPFAIISSLGKDYTMTSAKAPKGSSAVSLKSKNKTGDITGGVITFSNTTGWPVALRLTLAGRQSIDITINSVTTGGRLPDSYFRFDPRKYPGVQVVALR